MSLLSNTESRLILIDIQQLFHKYYSQSSLMDANHLISQDRHKFSNQVAVLLPQGSGVIGYYNVPVGKLGV